MTKSCQACRQHKKKCSQSKPSCQRCIQSQIACEYGPVSSDELNRVSDRMLFDRNRLTYLSKKMDYILEQAIYLGLVKKWEDIDEYDNKEGKRIRDCSLSSSSTASSKNSPLIKSLNSSVASTLQITHHQTVKFETLIKRLKKFHSGTPYPLRWNYLQKQYINILMTSFERLSCKLDPGFKLLGADMGLVRTFSHTSLVDSIISSYTSLHRKIYSFISERDLLAEADLVKSTFGSDLIYQSPLVDAITLKMLRYSRFLEIRDSNHDTLPSVNLKFNPKNLNKKLLPLPDLEHDPLYLKACQTCDLTDSDILSTKSFYSNFIKLQAGLLLVQLELNNLLQLKAYYRIMKLIKLAQTLMLHELDSSTNLIWLGCKDIGDLKLTWSALISNDALCSFLFSKPPLMGYTVPPFQFISSRNLLCTSDLNASQTITQSGLILYFSSKMQALFHNQTISLQTFQSRTFTLIQSLDSLYPNYNDIIDKKDITWLDSILLLIRGIKMIDIIEPLLDAFHTANLITPELQPLWQRMYSEAVSISHILASIPHDSILPTLDKVIPLAAFHAIKAFYKTKLSNFMKLDLVELKAMVGVCIKVYNKEVAQYPITNNTIDLNRFKRYCKLFGR